MMQPLRVSAIGATAAGMLLLSACTSQTASGGSAAVGSPAAEGTVRVTIDIPSSFDPTHALSLPDYLVSRASFDTLVRKDDSGLVPGLAESWTSTPTELEFVIRDGASCSDGTPLTASVVKDSLDYLATGENPNGPYTFGGQVPTITADDEARTVGILLDHPWSATLQALSISTTGIICPAGLADPEALALGEAVGAESGPYLLADSEPGISYTFELRDDYQQWAEWTTEIEGEVPSTLKYTVATDPTTTANLVLDGQIDIGNIQYESAERFEGADGFTVTPFTFGDYFLVFNEREGSPFADPELRKAVASIVDRDTFTEVTTGSFGTSAVSLTNENAACVTGDDSNLIPYDPTQGAALAGVKIRLVGPNILGPNGAGNSYVQEALRAAGAEVTLENVDVGTWISKVYGEPSSWDMTVFADLNFHGSLFHPLTYFTGPEIAAGGTNLGGVQDATVEEAFGASLIAEDETTYCAAIQQAADAVIEHAHGAPLTSEAYLYAQRDGYSIRMLGGSLEDPIIRITR